MMNEKPDVVGNMLVLFGFLSAVSLIFILGYNIGAEVHDRRNAELIDAAKDTAHSLVGMAIQCEDPDSPYSVSRAEVANGMRWYAKYLADTLGVPLNDSNGNPIVVRKFRELAAEHPNHKWNEHEP